MARDPEMVSEVLETMTFLAEGGMTMICVRHEMGFVRDVANRVTFIDARRMVEEASPQAFFSASKRERTVEFLNQLKHEKPVHWRSSEEIMTAQKLREKLAQGKTVTMINPHSNHSGLVQRLIEAGADAIFLDCEHGPWSHEDVRVSANAARMAGGSALVRPHSHERPVLIRYLNQGADGLMVPMVENADQARAVVEAMEYAYPDNPRGRFLVIMLESMNAIDNLDEMLKVGGIDVFFVGPTDLTQSMGLIPAPGPRPKEVVEAIEKVFGKVNAAGKVAGVLTNASDIEFWASKGGRYLYIHSDPFLRDGMKNIHSLIESGEAKRSQITS